MYVDKNWLNIENNTVAYISNCNHYFSNTINHFYATIPEPEQLNIKLLRKQVF